MKTKNVALALLLCALLCASTALAACGEKEHSHTLVRFNAISPSCLDEGYTEYFYCSDCGATFFDSVGKSPCNVELDCAIPPNGHAWSEWATTDDNDLPTCNGNGTQSRACQNCGEEQRRSTPPIGHDPILKAGYPPLSETIPGMKDYYVCSHCGEMFLDAECKIPTSYAELVLTLDSSDQP